MTFVFNDDCFAGDAFTVCFPIRDSICGPLVTDADVASVVCTARNQATNAIVNSRNAQNVLGVNGGSFVDGEFLQFFSASDTGLIGTALTTPRETHVFQFTLALDNGDIITWEYSLNCLARPAVAMNVATDLDHYRQLWRIETNEMDANVPTNDWIDNAFQDGAQAVNAVLRYCFADIEITLVAGTADYDLDPDFQAPLWGAWNGADLPLSDQDYLRRRGEWWIGQPVGPPEKYVIWQDKVIVIPTPTQAAVDTDPILLLRAYSAPPSVRLNGFAQLPEEYKELPRLYAALKWYSGPMGNSPAVAQQYMALWKDRLAQAVSDYSKRVVQ